MSLYELYFGGVEDPWYLSEPDPELDPGPFRRGERLEVSGELRFEVTDPGQALDVTLKGDGTIVASERIGALIEKLAPGDVQRLPARVEGSEERYEVLHILARLDCIDWENTKAYARADGEARGRNGTLASLGSMINRDRMYRHVTRETMRLSTGGIVGPRVFRVVNWDLWPMVTGDVKAALERERPRGLVFNPIGTTP